MKKYLLPVLMLLGVTTLQANPIYNLKPVKVDNGIYCSIGDINPPTKENKGNVNNTCWIDLGDSLVIVDPGPTYKFTKEFADIATKQSGKPIKAAVVTNYHDDRLYGASYYKSKNIPVIAHKSIVNDIKNHPEKFRRIPALLSKDDFAGTKLITPDTLFDKKYTIKGSKRSVELLKLSPVSEEHSDIVVWVPDVKFLFAGNIVFNDRALNYTKSSNMKGWLEALDKIEAMKPDIVLGGHGGTMGADAYKTTKQYLIDLQKQVKKAYDDDVDMSELMKHIDMTKYNHLKHAEKLNYHNANDYFEQLDWE